MGQEYPRARRITHRSEFKRLLNEGTRVRTSDLDVRKVASPLGCVRIGLIVPKLGRTGVARNKLKRRLRELVRVKLLPLDASYDVVIRTKGTAYERPFSALEKQVDEIAVQLKKSMDPGPEA